MQLGCCPIGVNQWSVDQLANVVRNIIAISAAGFLYDASDLHSLYQDNLGSTPVTAAGQTVGLVLDKSQGLVLGQERAGTYSLLTVTSPWIQISSLKYSIDGSQAGVTNVYFQDQFDKLYTTYEIVVNVTSMSGGVLSALNSSTSIALAVGINTLKFNSGGSLNFNISAPAGVAGIVELVSVRELPGIHSSQATSTSRPLYNSARSIDFAGIDDYMTTTTGGGGTAGFFYCAAIRVDGGNLTARTLWSDAGANTGYIIRVNASNQLEISAGNGAAYTVLATVATLSVGSEYVVTAWDDGVNLSVQVNSGTVAQVARPVVSAGTAAITEGRDNGAASSYFIGGIFAATYVKNGGVSAAQRADIQKFMARKAGITL